MKTLQKTKRKSKQISKVIVDELMELTITNKFEFFFLRFTVLFFFAFLEFDTLTRATNLCEVFSYELMVGSNPSRSQSVKCSMKNHI